VADNVLTAIRRWGGSVSRQCKQLYEFGPFRLDTEERQLLREEKPVPLTPKAYQTLRILVENSGELVAKEELMRQVWPDAFVEEGGLTRNISALRKALSDGRGEPYIQTVPRRGYRFVAKARKRVETTPYLRWINPEGQEETRLLKDEEILIGRKSDADLVLNNPYVSRHHARLVKGSQGFTIVDLDSTHGTFVNGQQVKQHELQSGDRVALGKDRVEMVYYTDDGETSGKETNRQDENNAKEGSRE
jgi:DNA-binding winged helix-turn-helix (wHTH) protein